MGANRLRRGHVVRRVPDHDDAGSSRPSARSFQAPTQSGSEQLRAIGVIGAEAPERKERVESSVRQLCIRCRLGVSGSEAQDYVVTYRQLREQRQDNMAFLCGDHVTIDESPLPPIQIADVPGPSEPTAPGAPLPPPIAPPILPPQEPASPTSPGGGS